MHATMFTLTRPNIATHAQPPRAPYNVNGDHILFMTCCRGKSMKMKAPKRQQLLVKSSSSDTVILPEDEFQLFYKVSDYDCYRLSDSPLLRDHVGLFTYGLSDFEDDVNNVGHVKLKQEKLDIIRNINVKKKHVSLLNIGIATSHCHNQGWIKVIDAFRSGGAVSISYQFQERLAYPCDQDDEIAIK